MIESSAMTRMARVVLPALVLTAFGLTACTSDPGADITPRSGTWEYVQTADISNTCMLDSPLPEFDLFTLDYDEGDSFQIELGEVDATCDIDGVEFDCADYTLSEDLIPGFDALIRLSVRWSGTLITSAEIDAREVISATCTGEDCNLVDNIVPCSRERTMTAEFVN